MDNNNKKPKRRKIKTPGFAVNIVCVLISAVFLSFIALLNIIFPTRADISETENRKLAEFPEFSFADLASGKYFQGLQSYVGDHFFQREALVNASLKLKTLDGFRIKVNGEWYYGEGGNQEIDETEDPNLEHLLSNLTLPPVIDPPEPTTEDITTKEPEITTVPGSDLTSGSSDITTEPIITEPPKPHYTSLTLSKTSAEVVQGATVTLTHTVKYEGGLPEEPVKWSVSDSSVISLTETLTGVVVETLAPGEATVTCTAGTLTASCKIKVTKIEASQGDPDAVEFLTTGGYLVYGKAAYVTAGYSASQAKVAESYKVAAEYYQKLFPGARVSVLVAPVSSVVLTDKAVTSKLTNQGEILSKMELLYKDSPVNFVNMYDTVMKHKNEYLYLHTDHHWNGLGAYYAYSDFVSSIGFTPTPLSGFDKIIQRESLVGSIYSYNATAPAAQILKANPDVLEAYVSKKECTMKITRTDGKTTTYKMAIFNLSSPSSGGIASFIGGDNPFTVINVPDNPQDLSILILKDSYADQFTPYLLEHYGYIYVVDPRYNSTKSLYNQLKDAGLDDILFLNNLQVANSAYWAKAYLRLVGVE
ncbi:MAG: DHHW family protein [Clostridia bacterium]|nr:DHHW family protein [Clostridia bacterium]